MPSHSIDLATLRREYSEHGIVRRDLAEDPIRQFCAWLDEALACALPEPNAMTLSTIDAAGQPWSRTVLLKGCDERGFAFFTNYNSAKGEQLATQPRAALTFWWAGLERQVNVTGSVGKTLREESERYFEKRPASAQIGAWASAQSEVMDNREQLERRFAEARTRFGDAQIPTPPHWGGYCVRPATIEFWQGRASRLHDRLRYTRGEDDAWKIERLSP